MEGLKKDVEMLNQALTDSRQECEEFARKESEAVEQVRRSVEVAEQLKAERSEMEYEIGQHKLQIDRLQVQCIFPLDNSMLEIKELL